MITFPQTGITQAYFLSMVSYLMMETVALSSVLPTAKVVSTKALSHKGQS